MYQVIRYVCKECKREFALPMSAEDCEKQDVEMRERQSKAIAFEDDWREKGHDVWYENGDQKHALKVDSELFGPHDYGDYDGTKDCTYGCNCWMGPTRSGGPVNPFGACPNNLLDTNQDEHMECGKLRINADGMILY